MQNRKDSLILKQKGNYIPLLKHGESVQVDEERGYCCPRTAKTGNLYRKKNRQSQEPIKWGFLIYGLIRKINIP